MKLLSDSTRPQLQRRINSLLRQLEEACPKLTREYRLVRELLDATPATGTAEFESISPSLAIQLVLTEANTWMTKQAIVDRLLAGGYDAGKKVSGKWAANDMINYMLGAGGLVQRGKQLRMATLVGLPDWDINDER